MNIAELINLCERKQLSKFQSTSTDSPVRIRTREIFSLEDSETDDYLKLNIKACHTLVNNNRSNISKEVMEMALPTFANKPILADVCEVHNKDGSVSYDFSGHTMEEIQDPFNPGQTRIRYIESVVGFIPETNNIRLEKEENSDKHYVFVDGYIFKEYGNFAADIIKSRKGQVDVSVELNVEEFSYDTKEKVLNIEKFTFAGITLLGANVKPGMEGANAQTYSQEEKFVYDNNLMRKVENMEELLSTIIERFNEQTSKKGGDEKVNFEKLLKKYNIKAEDVTFETDGLTDEELEAKFEETFGCKNTVASNDKSNTKKKYGNKEYSITENGDMIITLEKESYQISHDDIRYGLYNLCSSTYENENTWVYIMEVYDDTFIMQEYPSHKYYRQKYTKDDTNVSLDGERVQVYATYVTKEEEESLSTMRSTYEELLNYKETVESEKTKSQKEKMLSDSAYECLFELEEFKQLQKDIDQYTLEEIGIKADLIYAKYMKHNGAIFTSKEQEVKKPVRKIFTGERESVKGPYGDLFKDYEK